LRELIVVAALGGLALDGLLRFGSILLLCCGGGGRARLGLQFWLLEQEQKQEDCWNNSKKKV
jgi:hypothetical protein